MIEDSSFKKANKCLILFFLNKAVNTFFAENLLQQVPTNRPLSRRAMNLQRENDRVLRGHEGRLLDHLQRILKRELRGKGVAVSDLWSIILTVPKI